jgi:hypothetical protein
MIFPRNVLTRVSVINCGSYHLGKSFPCLIIAQPLVHDLYFTSFCEILVVPNLDVLHCVSLVHLMPTDEG